MNSPRCSLSRSVAAHRPRSIATVRRPPPPSRNTVITAPNPARIRDAASLILLRGPADDPRVLLGCRAASNRFAPGMYVFPGGELQREDFAARAAGALGAACVARMGVRGDRARAEALAKAAVRETLEETGLMVGVAGDVGDFGDRGDLSDDGDVDGGGRGDLSDDGDAGDRCNLSDTGDRGYHGDSGGRGDPGDRGDSGDRGDPGDRGDSGDRDNPGNLSDPGWRAIQATGMQPNLRDLTYLGRALTPPGMPLRYNARFFMARARAAHGEAADSDELSDLQWLRPSEWRALPLVPITAYLLDNLHPIIRRATAGEAFIYRHNGRHATVAWR
ncbi:MAG: NUDIX domain-containing protein [Gammaproteobacteria bacterium]|nr:NUDIX domain-containing protein [Gammaproteobacteria bacterium]